MQRVLKDLALAGLFVLAGFIFFLGAIVGLFALVGFESN